MSDKKQTSYFQALIILITLTCGNSVNILIHGLPFMKIKPKYFTCMPEGDDTSEWLPCSREEICIRELSPTDFAADTTHSEYISNW